MRRRVRPLASLSGSEVQIWHCRELWCRPAAVDSIRPLPSLGTSIRHKCSPKKQKEKKKSPQTAYPSPVPLQSSLCQSSVVAPTDGALLTQQGLCLCCQTTGALHRPGPRQVKGGEAGNGGRRLPGQRITAHCEQKRDNWVPARARIRELRQVAGGGA